MATELPTRPAYEGAGNLWRSSITAFPCASGLPAIAMPLRQTDRDIPLDLQAILNECCEEGRYVDDIDYREEPDPPLGPDDARWAEPCSKSRATDSRRSSPVDEPFNRD